MNTHRAQWGISLMKTEGCIKIYSCSSFIQICLTLACVSLKFVWLSSVFLKWPLRFPAPHPNFCVISEENWKINIYVKSCAHHPAAYEYILRSIKVNHLPKLSWPHIFSGELLWASTITCLFKYFEDTVDEYVWIVLKMVREGCKKERPF